LEAGFSTMGAISSPDALANAAAVLLFCHATRDGILPGSGGNQIHIQMKTGRQLTTLLIAMALTGTYGYAQQVRDSVRTGAQVPFSMDVVFVQYSAYNSPSGNVIRWSTILETNLDHYVVERGNGNGPFQSIATIDPFGSTTAAVSYVYTDTRPLKGKNIYRIRMVDTRNGSKVYSTRIVNWSYAEAGAQFCAAYPNPVSRGSGLSIDFNQAGTYQVSLVGMATGQVESRPVSSDGRSTYSFPVPDRIPKGEYMLIIRSGDSTILQQKFFVQ
jgi:hypothetical protein